MNSPRTLPAAGAALLLALSSAPAGAQSPDHVSARADSWTVPLDAWQRPRTAKRVLSEPSIRATVQAWLRHAGGGGSSPLLVISHPGDEDGKVWAGELRDWLIALAIPSDAIMLRPGGTSADTLTLFIESR